MKNRNVKKQLHRKTKAFVATFNAEKNWTRVNTKKRRWGNH